MARIYQSWNQRPK